MKLVVDHSKREERISGLYLITDQGIRLVERVREGLAGGAKVLQYRDKSGSYPEKLAMGSALKLLCARFDATFIVNDDVALAAALDADGVHLGQEDGDLRQARELLGPNKLIGVSTHNLEEALSAEAAGADYVGFGAIYPTFSKEVPAVRGAEAIREIKSRLRIPVVAIGGITRDNAVPLIDNGVDAVAVISSVLSARAPGIAANELALLFNRSANRPRGTVLTVAGSDSAGGAGIQGDLKTIALLGSYGASVITALTAQNSLGVAAIHPVPPSFLVQQLDAVLSDLPIQVVKIGMLSSPENARLLAEKLEMYGQRMVILDPVMVAKGGAHLLEEEAIGVLKRHLIPASYLVTPNLPEAQRLTGLLIEDALGMEQAARALHQMGARNVLIKGGHQVEGVVTDLFYDGSGFTRFSAPRTLTRHTHGTGCALASAIATYLAQGEPLPAALEKAKGFITRAIRYSHPLGRGHGPVNHYMAACDRTEPGPK